MTVTPPILGAGAGLVSSALFASAITGTPIAGLLFYLAPLPICLAGLGWGTVAGIAAGAAGTLVTAAVLGPGLGLLFALALGLPLATLCYFALLSRQNANTGQDSVAAVEWYPIGRLVGWAAIIGGLLAGVMMLYLGHDTESYREAIKDALQKSALKDQFDEAAIASLSTVAARGLPALFGISWMIIALFNLWLGGVIVEASGRALRPWPKLDDIEVPSAFFLAFTASLVFSFVPGLVGLIATGFAGALLFAYVLQGLSVLHAYTRGMPFRGALLASIYLGILLLGWLAIVIAIIGLSEPMLRLRERAGARGQPPRSD
jgi:hypothetical protein